MVSPAEIRLLIPFGGGGDLSDYSSNTSLYTLTNAVQNLAVTATSTTSVTLDWDAPSGGASTYKILYGQILILFLHLFQLDNLNR